MTHIFMNICTVLDYLGTNYTFNFFPYEVLDAEIQANRNKKGGDSNDLMIKVRLFYLFLLSIALSFLICPKLPFLFIILFQLLWHPI